MLKATTWSGGAVVAAIAMGAWWADRGFRRLVAADARQLWAGRPGVAVLDRSRMDALPPPVRAYLDRALGARSTAVRSLRLRHGGEFRTRLDGAFVPIRGEQYFAASPPGFVWWGRVRIVPGLWVDARDRALRGAGSMLVRLESLVTLADASGPELDQGALLRLLGELTWLPTAFLDDRYVAWSPVDSRQARATLRLAGREVSCLFEFGPDGLPTVVRAERYRDLGNGRSALTPWSGEPSDFREEEGLLVPHLQTAFWHVGGDRVPYARFRVERMQYDAPEPF